MPSAQRQGKAGYGSARQDTAREGNAGQCRAGQVGARDGSGGEGSGDTYVVELKDILFECFQHSLGNDTRGREVLSEVDVAVVWARKRVDDRVYVVPPLKGLDRFKLIQGGSVVGKGRCLVQRRPEARRWCSVSFR